MNGDDEAPQVAGLPLKWTSFPWPAGSTPPAAGIGEPAFRMYVLQDPDTLLDLITEEEYRAHDDRMPYFGEIWPSAESLVAKLLSGPPLDGTRVLDLGCGLGPCGFAAAARGAHVTFMDWEPRALEIIGRSVVKQGRPLSDFDFVVADWRKPPPLAPFRLVLGADVLYEERNAPAVAAFLAAHLPPGGEAWIGDPGRPHSRRFPALAQQHGLTFRGSEILPPQKHGIEVVLQRYARD